jgi:hypothetical protein
MNKIKPDTIPIKIPCFFGEYDVLNWFTIAPVTNDMPMVVRTFRPELPKTKKWHDP